MAVVRVVQENMVIMTCEAVWSGLVGGLRFFHPIHRRPKLQAVVCICSRITASVDAGAITAEIAVATPLGAVWHIRGLPPRLARFMVRLV